MNDASAADDEYYMGITQVMAFLQGFVTGAATRLARTQRGKKSQNVYVLVEPGRPAILGIHIVSDKNRIGELQVKLTGDEAVSMDVALMLVDAFIDQIEKEEKPTIEESKDER